MEIASGLLTGHLKVHENRRLDESQILEPVVAPRHQMSQNLSSLKVTTADVRLNGSNHPIKSIFENSIN